MMNIIFPIMFVVVFMFIAFAFVQVISTWNQNNHSPRLTVPAVVVAKREKIHISSMPMQAICAEHTVFTLQQTPHIMLHFRWEAETEWSFMFWERNTECLQKVIPADSPSKERDIYHLSDSFLIRCKTKIWY